MRVLILGAAGFIGSHLCRHLDALPAFDVSCIDRRDGDLSDYGQTDNIIRTYQPDTVVHLAAQVGREFGERNAAFTITTNAVVTANVALACREYGARLVYASTSEVYGDCERHNLVASDESLDTLYADSPLGARVGMDSRGYPLPYNLYGLSKRWGEEVARLYSPDGLDILRLSMPYGPGLPPGKGRAAIVNMLAQAHRGEPIIVHRGAERCWCWIGDTVEGIRLIIEKAGLYTLTTEGVGPNEPQAWNVGRDDACTSMECVAELAILTVECVKDTPSEIELVDAPPGQILVKHLPTAKLRSLGWAPKTSLEDGMRRTYEAMLTAGHLP